MEKNKNLYNRPNDSLSRNPQQRRRRRASIRNHSAGYHDYKSQRVIQIQICQKVMDNKMKKKKGFEKKLYRLRNYRVKRVDSRVRRVIVKKF